MKPLDCLIVGAGPGGLTGAIYLGRFLRDVLVVEDGDPRAGWIPRSHNHPGFPDGVPGRELLARMRAQADRYGARFELGMAETLTLDADGAFTVGTTNGPRRARNVLLATGVKDEEPDLPDVFGAVQRGLIRICPICDAYEVQGKAVGVIGSGDFAAREALFIRTYTPDLKILSLGRATDISADNRAELAAAGIEVVETSVGHVDCLDDRILALEFAGGVRHRFDSIYSALGVTPRSELAHMAGALTGKDGRLWVNDHQMTSVGGLYAAGDVVRGLNQISIAQGEAAIAATDIHNRLRDLERAER